MAKRGESTIDTKRNLCDTCKHVFPDCNGEIEFGDNIGSNNIIRCTSYKKKPQTSVPRLKVGQEYWVYILKDQNVSMNEFIPKKRTEEEKNATNTLYYQIGNYFYTEEDCWKEIERVTKLKNK